MEALDVMLLTSDEFSASSKLNRFLSFGENFKTFAYTDRQQSKTRAPTKFGVPGYIRPLFYLMCKRISSYSERCVLVCVGFGVAFREFRF